VNQSLFVLYRVQQSLPPCHSTILIANLLFLNNGLLANSIPSPTPPPPLNSLRYICIHTYGQGSSIGIATELRAGRSGIESRWGTRFSTRPDRPWGPPSLLYNGFRVFPGGKVRPGRAADHSRLSSEAVVEEWSYTSTHSLSHTGPVTGSLYLYVFMYTHVRSSSESLMNYVALPWVVVDEPWHINHGSPTLSG